MRSLSDPPINLFIFIVFQSLSQPQEPYLCPQNISVENCSNFRWWNCYQRLLLSQLPRNVSLRKISEANGLLKQLKRRPHKKNISVSNSRMRTLNTLCTLFTLETCNEHDAAWTSCFPSIMAKDPRHRLLNAPSIPHLL